MKRYHSYLFLLFIIFLSPLHAQSSNANLNKLFHILKSNNHIILLRHSIAPGSGDPKNFKISDCQTQRNLSKQGVKQAQDIGLFLKKLGYQKATIYSSEWCRCKDTARALNLGKFKTLNLLNSFFSNISIESRQTLALEKWIEKLSLNSPTILVTHQVNITALTGYFPAQGELIFVKRLKSGKITIIDSIKANIFKS